MAVVWCTFDAQVTAVPLVIAVGDVVTRSDVELSPTEVRQQLVDQVEALCKPVLGGKGFSLDPAEVSKERYTLLWKTKLDPVTFTRCMLQVGLTGSPVLSVKTDADGIVPVALDANYVGSFAPGWQFKPDGDPDAGAPSTPTPPVAGASTVIIDTGYASPPAGLPTDGKEAYATVGPALKQNLAQTTLRHGPFIGSLLTVQGVPFSLGVLQSSMPRPDFTTYELLTTVDRVFGFGATTVTVGATKKRAGRFGVITANAVGVNARVVNMSFGTSGIELATGDPLPLTNRTFAVQVAGLLSLSGWSKRDAPPVIVAAAGNSGTDVPFFPAAWASTKSTVLTTTAAALGLAPSSKPIERAIVSVGAGTSAAKRAMYSNYGDWVTTWMEGTCTAQVPDGATTAFWKWQGTSFATANATAVLSLMSSVYMKLLADPTIRNGLVLAKKGTCT